MNDRFFIYGGKIILHLVGDVLYFPLWWYSVGLGRLLKNLFDFLRGQEESLGFLIWAKNIFVPMYGQNDWAGRLISFFVRLVQIIARGLALLFWLLIALIILAAWLALPVATLSAIIWQFLR